jgi:VCBS repeat protein
MRHVVCAFTIWLAGASFAVAQPFTFHGGAVGSGGSPRGIVAADFDGDGHLDFATANFGSAPHDVSVWHGDGHGGFNRPEFYSVGSGPFSIAAGDVNHDGHPDLAVAVADANKLTILLWTTSGFVVSANIEFPPDSVEVPFPGNPREVVIADFNRDGNADLAYTLYGQGLIEITLGAGDGVHWERHFGLIVSRGVHGLAVADLNNDGLPDIVATNAIDGKVYVAYNAGSGQVPFVETYNVGQSPRNVTIGDFNHDRHPDFAIINTDSGTVSIYFWNPAVTDTTQITSPTPHFGNRVTVTGVGVSPRDIEAVDADGDGVVDLAISDYGEDRLLVLKNDGTGHFPVAGRVRVESVFNPRTLAIGDYDEDGRPDILVGNQGNGAVILFMNGTAFPGRP